MLKAWDLSKKQATNSLHIEENSADKKAIIYSIDYIYISIL